MGRQKIRTGGWGTSELLKLVEAGKQREVTGKGQAKVDQSKTRLRHTSTQAPLFRRLSLLSHLFKIPVIQRIKPLTI